MDVTLTAESGRPTGSRSSRRLRAQGKVPGVVYGLGQDPILVSVPWPELRRALTTDAGLNALITLDVDGSQDLTIVKDIQRDPVRRDVTHVDFIRIDATEEIEVEVPVELTGEPEQLTFDGGLVEHVLHTLTVKAKPGAIPNELVVDISEITVETPVRVGDIALPEGVTTEVDLEDPVATGYIPRVEIEPEAEEEAELAEGEEAPEGEPAAEGDAGDEGGGDSEPGD